MANDKSKSKVYIVVELFGRYVLYYSSSLSIGVFE